MSINSKTKELLRSKPLLRPLVKVLRKANELRRRNDPSGCYYNIENPKQPITNNPEVVIDGWLIPRHKSSVVKLRAINGGKYYDVPYGFRRADVAKSYTRISQSIAANSGFSLNLKFEDGPIELEVDIGKGFRKIFSINMLYSPERLPEAIYNPKLSKLWPEHVNLLENKNQYYYEDQVPNKYTRHPDDPRLIALYLPQFHPIPENDANWGKNFTEWTNVTQGVPRFVGHLQPILPKDLGFYDLRIDSNIKDQIDLAKYHGIYGFCFYYYWFSGKKVMDTPLNSFLRHKEWDFNFNICWANENWTKRWDGRDSDVIVAQKYLPEDPLNFIKDIESILIDDRYITEDGKPILLVYRPTDLDDPANYAKIWRQYFSEKHGKGLHLVAVISFDDKDPRTYGFDAAMDFSPQGTFFKNQYFEGGTYPLLSVQDRLLDIGFQGDVADYRAIVLNRKLYDAFDYPSYKCVTPSWDNDARKKGKGFVFQNSNPDLYAQYLEDTLSRETNKIKAPLIFINAWNEWAEGAMLEPSQHYGHANLNRTGELVAKYGQAEAHNLSLYRINRDVATTLAVVIHLYYPEQWSKIKDRLEAALGNINYDLFVSLSKKDSDFANEIKQFKPEATIRIVPNRGRDVLPFLHIVHRLEKAGYAHILKIHTKQSKHRIDGSEWFEDLLTKLLPNPKIVSESLELLNTQATIIGPEGHFLSLERYMGGNSHHLKLLLSRIFESKITHQTLTNTKQYGFFGGTMLWLSISSLKPLLDLYLMPEDFESEHGQIDATLAHAIERTISLLPQLNDQKIYQVSAKGISAISPPDIITKYKYAP